MDLQENIFILIYKKTYIKTQILHTNNKHTNKLTKISGFFGEKDLLYSDLQKMHASMSKGYLGSFISQKQNLENIKRYGFFSSI